MFGQNRAPRNRLAGWLRLPPLLFLLSSIALLLTTVLRSPYKTGIPLSTFNEIDTLTTLKTHGLLCEAYAASAGTCLLRDEILQHIHNVPSDGEALKPAIAQFTISCHAKQTLFNTMSSEEQTDCIQLAEKRKDDPRYRHTAWPALANEHAAKKEPEVVYITRRSPGSHYTS